MSDEITWTDLVTWQVRHETKKEIDSGSKFFANTTGMSHYDNLLEYPEYHKQNKGECGKIKMMPPDKYIYSCSRTRRGPSSIEAELRGLSDTLIDEYYRRAMNGEKMPIPTLDIKRCTQEGRHRAMVAKKIGLKDIPVLVVEEC